MSTKNFIRVAVLAALAAWPGVETCRLFQAQQQRDAAAQRESLMVTHVAHLKAKHEQIARSQKAAVVQPVVNQQ